MDFLFELIISYVSVISIISAAIFSVFALRRFLSGEFFNIAKWVTYSYVFLAIYKTAEEASRLVSAYEDAFEYAEYIFFLAGVLCAIRSAYLLYKFSKVYGFKSKQRKKE